MKRFLPGTWVLAALVLAGCGSFNFNPWPFGGVREVERPRVPPGANEYLCVGGKTLFLRWFEGRSAVWVILPEREFRLDRQGATGRYGNGVAVLSEEGGEIALSDGPQVSYSGCRAPKEGDVKGAG